jgi:S-adenosylmethionine-diacylglycerol 3-amino-3-carboxypropyl transferase
VSRDYFQQLNYTLANEDASIEAHLLPDSVEHVAAVCGSGSRIIPLLSKSPRRISIVDISESQLFLCSLRIETLRKLERTDFLQFWGYQRGMGSSRRREIFLSLPLIDGAIPFLQEVFEAHHWNPILLEGRWERTFQFFSKLAKGIVGKKRIEGLFACRTIEAQVQYVEKHFKGLRWKTLLLIAGNARTFNALLYAGSFPVNNTGKSYVRYYQEAFERLFAQDLARNNFFLQLTLLGELRFPEGLPAETTPEIYEAARAALSKIQIDYIKEDLVTHLSKSSGLDFISFSNVASYFTGEMERIFLNKIKSSMKPGSRIVLRHYLHHPERLDREGFVSVTDSCASLLALEKMQMYDIEILERTSS